MAAVVISDHLWQHWGGLESTFGSGGASNPRKSPAVNAEAEAAPSQGRNFALATMKRWGLARANMSAI